MGGAGLEEVRFVKPVRPGDRLCARIRILEATASKTRADRGTTLFVGVFVDENDEVVFSHRGRALFRRRQPLG
jgi:acyl dehydratase